jgi:hypothetical protein
MLISWSAQSALIHKSDLAFRGYVCDRAWLICMIIATCAYTIMLGRLATPVCYIEWLCRPCRAYYKCIVVNNVRSIQPMTNQPPQYWPCRWSYIIIIFHRSEGHLHVENFRHAMSPVVNSNTSTWARTIECSNGLRSGDTRSPTFVYKTREATRNIYIVVELVDSMLQARPTTLTSQRLIS